MKLEKKKAAEQANDVRTLFIAHRGASFDAPENTIAAINLAWQKGSDAVEIDIQLTKDNEIVVFHDDYTERYNGQRKTVANYTFKELQQIDAGSFKGKQWAGEHIPKLEDVLDTVPEGKRLFIELKSGMDVIPGLRNILNRRHVILQQIVFISFSRKAIRAIKQIYPENVALRIYEPVKLPFIGKWIPSPGKMIREVLKDQLDGLDLSIEPAISQKFIRRVHSNNLKLVVWTVNGYSEARSFYESKIFGITTDRPVWLRDHFLKQPGEV